MEEPSIVPFKKKKKKGRAINSFSLSGMRVKHVTLAGGERSSPFNHLITSYF